MKYAVEASLDGIAFIPSFMKIGQLVQYLYRGAYRHRNHGGIIGTLLFLRKVSRIKIGYATCKSIYEYADEKNLKLLIR
jgi:hypothetical protein